MSKNMIKFRLNEKRLTFKFKLAFAINFSNFAPITRINLFLKKYNYIITFVLSILSIIIAIVL